MKSPNLLKNRSIALCCLLGLSFVLAACSLAEDITPPPGYIYSTPAAAQSQGSQTPVASVTSTPEQSPGTPTPASSTAPAASGTPAALITLKGKVTNASGSPLPAALTAVLYLFNTGSSNVDQTRSTVVLPTGEYQFDNVPGEANVSYFIMVESGGVTYASDPITYDGSFTTKDVPIAIYDTTDDLTQLSISQIHMQFDFSVTGQVDARMLYIVNDLGNKSVVVQSDGTHIPFIQIPSGATNVQYELAQGGAVLSNATNGFALLPGMDKQYGIVATFSLPYQASLDLVQPFSIPVSSETVIVPVGVQVHSAQLTDAGVQNFQGTDYHLYQGGVLATGSSLALTLSGLPGGSSGSTVTQRTAVLIGVGGAGLLLIAVGIFLFRRGRRRLAVVPAGVETPEADRDAIMDAIIALDDQYKAGVISREVYGKRREALKQKLRDLV